MQNIQDSPRQHDRYDNNKSMDMNYFIFLEISHKTTLQAYTEALEGEGSSSILVNKELVRARVLNPCRLL